MAQQCRESSKQHCTLHEILLITAASTLAKKQLLLPAQKRADAGAALAVMAPGEVQEALQCIVRMLAVEAHARSWTPLGPCSTLQRHPAAGHV